VKRQKKALIGDNNHEPIDVAPGPKEDRSFTESHKNWNFDMSRVPRLFGAKSNQNSLFAKR
jgi:hypothetical protein